MSKNLRSISSREKLHSLQHTKASTPSHFPAAAQSASDSFYDHHNKTVQFKAYRCSGTVCRMSNKQKNVSQYLLQHHAKDEIGEMACVGRCYQGGAAISHGHSLAIDHNDRPLSDTLHYQSDVTSPLFAPLDQPEHYYAKIAKLEVNLLDDLKLSGLRGRGGAGFPFAHKLTSFIDQNATPKYLVCNADEGDPGAFSDRYILEQTPERLIAGMWLLGRATATKSAIIYLRMEYPEAKLILKRALQDYQGSPLYQRYPLEFRIVFGHGSYVCGEETALMNSIEGLRPEVRVRPPFPTEQGLFSQPTLLSNVETLAAISWIASRGGETFAQLGRAESRGTKLISLDHWFKRPGIYEVEMGTPLQRVIDELGCGWRTPVKALQIGGPLGGVVPVEQLKKLTLDFESFAGAGFLLGHAGMVSVPVKQPMLDLLQHLWEYMSNESCGRCFPCRLGTRKGFEMLSKVSVQQPLDLPNFTRLLQTLEQGSLCALGGGLPLPTRNILQHFAAELSPVIPTRIL